jgi:hypothetical protein
MTWLLANWRLAVLGGVALVAAVQTYRLQNLAIEHEKLQGKYTVFVRTVEGIAKQAKAEADAKDVHNGRVKEELNREIAKQEESRALERAERSERFAGLYDRYMRLRDDPGSPGGGAVPEAGGGAAATVRTGLTVTFDRERFVGGLRSSLDALHSDLEPLIERGTDGLDDRQHWGQWARLVAACPKP